MERMRTGLRVPYDLNTWLVKEAEKIGISKNALVVQILWDWADRQGKLGTDRQIDKELGE